MVDSIHLVDLGVMKKLLTVIWMPGHKTKLEKTQILRRSQRLMNSSTQSLLNFNEPHDLLENRQIGMLLNLDSFIYIAAC